MKRVVLSLSALTALGAMTLPVFGHMSLIDTAGDGVASFVEMQRVYPDLDNAGFDAIDTNGDGMIDQGELDAAIAEGLIDAPAETD